MLKKIASLAFIPCLVIGAVLFWIIPCEATWIRTYGGTASDDAYFVRQTSDGGYIVAGQTLSFGAGDTDAWLLKLDSEGNMMWQKTYGGTGFDSAYSVQQTSPDGGYIVAGQTYSSGAGDQDIWLLKLTANGDIVWQKTYGGGAWDFANFVQQTSDGGYIVAGGTSSFGAGEKDVWLLKLDENGIVTWQKTYGGVTFESATSVQQTSPDGGYIVVGTTVTFGAGEKDVWLLKLDANGDVTWQKTYGGTAGDEGYSVQQTSDGGYIVAGGTRSFGEGNYDIWLLKLDGGGDIVWQKTYGGNAWDYPYSVQQTSDGGYIVAAETGSFSGSRDAWLLKVDSTGNVTWEKIYGGTPGYDYAYSVQQTSDGGYIVLGGNESFSVGNNDTWVMKMDSAGSTGNCPFEGISAAVVSNTEVTPTITTVVPANTLVTGVDTAIVPVDSTATSSEICPLSDKQFLLKVNATRKRQGEGTIESLDGLIDCPDACQAEYNPGAMVNLTATPSVLSTFLGWKPTSPGCEGTNLCTVTMDKKKSVKAVFQGPNKLKVVTTFKNGGTGTVTSSDTLINCPTDCEESYKLSSSVTLTATPTQGTFVKWTGKACKDQQTNVCTFNMEKNATVKAIFEPTP